MFLITIFLYLTQDGVPFLPVNGGNSEDGESTANDVARSIVFVFRHIFLCFRVVMEAIVLFFIGLVPNILESLVWLRKFDGGWWWERLVVEPR